MILIDNRNLLRIKHRELLQQLSIWDEKPYESIEIDQAKTGVPTVKVELEGKTQYIQSKYDPEREAKRLADKHDEESVRHILFIGVGMGYHINSYLEAHVDVKFSIYEPNEEILHAYLSNMPLDKLPIQQLQSVFTGTDEELLTEKIQGLLAASNNVLKIITLPVYENIYGEQIQLLLQRALESVKDRHSALATNAVFQKRWTINSIKNFATVLKTPNILHDIDRSAFEGKPAIIVAAGPSLNEEFKNLRYIKENGLAYIFSVGSAINALIEQGIYPDAACTYDPKERNQNVIKIIKDKNIKDIPLIFGTSVGYETIENYPGILLSMVTSQDIISSYLLGETENLSVINDAPSIAVITLQLLIKLGFSEIILVGQNLSFRNNKRFAEGINYRHISNSISEEKKKDLVPIKDVYGEIVFTEDMYIRMLDQFKLYINANPQTNVINTTKGGAAIEGTEFIELATLIKKTLHKSVVIKNWYEGEVNSNINHIVKKLTILNKAHLHLDNQLKDVMEILDRILENESLNIRSKLESLHLLLDKKVSLLSDNHYYQVIIKSMIKVQYERLQERVLKLKYEQNIKKKSKEILETFRPFIIACKEEYQNSTPLFLELLSNIEGMRSNEEN
ncbi:motility associated factor glycosyltransferase family protein [Sporosarcina sp. FSL W7-1283]|uniref:motility associated factor glycosyltransferase family protein n=1 Tax=Sporosarcina sp. FSL W7-1283 TaxID=2921560 RepID=UPI0030F5A399